MSSRAIVLEQAFGIDQLVLAERGIVEPGRSDVRLRVGAVSLNRRDLLLVQGIYNPRQELPIVPCSDAAGIVEAVGPECRRFQPGDRVALHFFLGWPSGEPTSAKLATALGGPGGDGTLREHMIVPEDALVRLPDTLSIDAAATLPCAALTAWSAIVDLGRTRPGDCVLIQGTGGVSMFALQFAKMMGAFVVATTSSADKAARLTALGADAVVNYATDRNWATTARELANGRIDLVVDVGGHETLDASLRAVRPGGTIALIGVLGGAKATVTLTLAVMRQVRLQGVTCGDREAFEAMIRAIAQNGIDPVIDSVYPLAEAADAFLRMESNAHVGKIVVQL
jgi:NADPH:quinone reductase-like Zn-dependent oxidoreductase